MGKRDLFLGGKAAMSYVMKLTIHLHLMLRSRMHGAIPPLPKMPSWHGTQSTGQLYLYLYLYTSREEGNFLSITPRKNAPLILLPFKRLFPTDISQEFKQELITLCQIQMPQSCTVISGLGHYNGEE